ncbi:MAG: hypothetical protein QFF03_18530, partial [Pseudomonadota bacterium]|nr:hypothetical protein [Pseudomonadota bacterium]
MKIAKLFDRSFVSTFIERDSVCASACVIIWAGGVQRSISGTLGVHRIASSSTSVDINRLERV